MCNYTAHNLDSDYNDYCDHGSLYGEIDKPERNVVTAIGKLDP